MRWIRHLNWWFILIEGIFLIKNKDGIIKVSKV